MKARNAKLKSEGGGLGLCGLMGPTTLINNPEKLFSYRFYKPFFFSRNSRSFGYIFLRLYASAKGRISGNT